MGWVLQFVNLIVDGFDGLRPCFALLVPIAMRSIPVMVESGADAARHLISQPLLGADSAEQPRGKAAAESLIEYLHGIEIGIVAAHAQLHHADVALVHVRLVDEVVAGLGGVECNIRLLRRGASFPGAERLAQLGFHRSGIEVAHETQNDVVGMDVGAVPVNQILRG